MDTNYYKELKLEDILVRLNDLRMNLLYVASRDVLDLIEEVARRLAGGTQVQPSNKLSPDAAEQKLREHYQFLSTHKRFKDWLQPYHIWREDHLKYEKQRKSDDRANTTGTNKYFQERVTKFLKKGGRFDFEIDKNFALSDKADGAMYDELRRLWKNKISREILKKNFNLRKPDEEKSEGKIRYWLFSRDLITKHSSRLF